MPTYTYQCADCEHVFERVLPIAAREDPTHEPCPHCGKLDVKKLVNTPPVCDPVRMGRIKAPDGFRDVLRNIRDRNPGSVLDI
jgi:putative FmdB family regulatory protein